MVGRLKDGTSRGGVADAWLPESGKENSLQEAGKERP